MFRRGRKGKLAEHSALKKADLMAFQRPNEGGDSGIREEAIQETDSENSSSRQVTGIALVGSNLGNLSSEDIPVQPTDIVARLITDEDMSDPVKTGQTEEVENGQVKAGPANDVKTVRQAASGHKNENLEVFSNDQGDHTST